MSYDQHLCTIFGVEIFFEKEMTKEQRGLNLKWVNAIIISIIKIQATIQIKI